MTGIVAGVISAVVGSAILAGFTVWWRRHRIRVKALAERPGGSAHFLVLLYNDGARPVHVFEAGVIRVGLRYNAAEPGGMTGRDVQPFRDDFAMIPAALAREALQGEPTHAYVRVHALLRREYRCRIEPPPA